MFFYLFSFFSQTKIYNSDNFIDLELGIPQNISLSTKKGTKKNYKNFPTILIH